MFNQAQVLAVVTGIAFLIVGMLVRLPYTDGVRVEDDGYQLGLKTSGLSMMRSSSDMLLTQHGAAEHFWAQFITPLQ